MATLQRDSRQLNSGWYYALVPPGTSLSRAGAGEILERVVVSHAGAAGSLQLVVAGTILQTITVPTGANFTLEIRGRYDYIAGFQIINTGVDSVVCELLTLT